jgi:hypothetical protein
MSDEEFCALGLPGIVYVRPTTMAEIIKESPEVPVDGHEPTEVIFSVHRANGERLAVLTDRGSAFAAALAHDLCPVSVH